MQLVFQSEIASHGAAYIGQPEFVRLVVISDSLIAASCCVIVLSLLYLDPAARRGQACSFIIYRGPPFQAIDAAFIFLVLGCATTYLSEIFVLLSWSSRIGRSDQVKAPTAITSVAASIWLMMTVLKVASVPNRSQLSEAFAVKTTEIEAHSALHVNPASKRSAAVFRASSTTWWASP